MRSIKQKTQLEMKIENRMAVMEQIKDEESVSRASLARELKMSPTSMTRICGDLTELGLIHEIQKEGPGGVGRKAVWLRKNPEAFYSLGILVRLDFIGCVIVNYGEEVVFQKKWKEKVPSDCRCLAETAADHIREIEKEQPEVFKKIEAAGISFPGIIEADSGRIRYSDLFGWEDENLADLLAEKIGIPCCMVRDIKASVIEEFHCGSRKEKTMGFLSLSQEVGAAFIRDGRILYGADGLCGEIAHKMVIFNGRKCACGKKGCAAAYLTESAIIEQAGEAGHPCDSLSQIAEACQRGESWASELLQKLSQITAFLAEDMILWNNPERIVLGGRTVRIFPELIGLVQKDIKKMEVHLPAVSKIEASYNAGSESMLGAAYTAMDENEKRKINSLKEM